METNNNINEKNKPVLILDVNTEQLNFKEKSKKIIDGKTEILKIHSLIESFTSTEEQKDFIELIEISNTLDLEEKYNILYFLIENGIHFASIYSNILNLNTKNIDTSLFLYGIKKGGDSLLFSENFDSFINLCNDSILLKKELGKKGLFEQYDYYFFEDNSLGKIEKKDTLLAIENYKERFTGDTLDKLNSFGLYDWDLIIENIFEDYIYAKDLFFKLFKLNNKEKQDLANLKVDQLNYDYYDEKELIIEEVENSGMTLYSSLEYNNNEILNIDKFINELNKISVLKNYANEFHVTFFDITGRINHLELTSQINKLLDSQIAYDNVENFNSKIKDIFESYIHFLNINNFNFEILFFKSNGINHNNDNQGINNINYQGKVLKAA